MKIKQTILIFALLIGIGGLLSGPNTSATDCGGVVLKSGQNCCGGVATSIIACDNKQGLCNGGENAFEGSDPGADAKLKTDYKTSYGHEYGVCADGSVPNTDVEKNGIWSLLLLAINILTAGVVIAAIGGVVYGSILYTTAGGSLDQVKKARTIIGNVIVGILAYALMFSFINFIIPGGLFK